MVYNKKGVSPTLMLFFFVFFVFFIVLFAGVSFFALEKFNNIFGGITGLQIGDVDFNQNYEDTVGKGIRVALNSLVTGALGVVLGMIIVMLIIGFKIKSSRLWIVLDIVVIIGSFIAAVYISQTFDTFINTSADLLDIFSNDFELASSFILNLPAIVTIVGALVMLATYVTFKKKEPGQLGQTF